MERPSDPTHIARAGTPDEVWWTGEAWIPAQTDTSPNMAKVVSVYSAIKDARTAKRHEWEKEDQALEEDMHKLKLYMFDILNKTGAKSIATDFGTVYRTEKVRPSAADWTAVYRWIMEKPERFELLEKRLKSTFVTEYMEENEGELPPGVNVHREYEVAVRKS